jgi:hypothetical protein
MSWESDDSCVKMFLQNGRKILIITNIAYNHQGN